MSPLWLVGSQDGVCAFLGCWLWELSFSYVPSLPNPSQTGAAGRSVHPRLDPNLLDFLNFRHQAVLKVFRLEAASPRTLKGFQWEMRAHRKLGPLIPYAFFPDISLSEKHTCGLRFSASTPFVLLF